MSQRQFYLAEINIARMTAPLDDPIMQDFVDGLDPINALADSSPGFVWRLQTEDGDATSLRVFDDDMLIVNISMWESVEALKHYVYKTMHTDFLRRKREWFEKMSEHHFVMWWVPVDHRPTIEEAKARLAHLRKHGDTAQAFTFREVFAPAPILN